MGVLPSIAAAVLLPVATFALSPFRGPTLETPRAAVAPTLDGTLTASEWTGPAIPVTFRLPNQTVTGSIRSTWDANHLYLAVELFDPRALVGTKQLDVAVDEDGDGILTTGDPAYLTWTNGKTQEFHYEAARRGFVLDRREARAGFQRAYRREANTITFELAIPYDAQDWEDLDYAPGPAAAMRLALKYERSGAAGQFDSWPVPGTRDALTRDPFTWATIAFRPQTTDDRTPPTVELTIAPDRPAPTQAVSWRAKAFDDFGLDRIELWENGARIRTCTATTICEHSTGPYAAGLTVRAEAVAYDRNGNRGVAATVFAIIAPTPLADTTPPSQPLLVQAVNPGTGTSVYLFWVNPSDADFAKVRIYRSTSSGALGAAIASAANAPYVDGGLSGGTTYWYTIRAVDTAGNESTNTAQVAVTPHRP